MFHSSLQIGPHKRNFWDSVSNGDPRKTQTKSEEEKTKKKHSEKVTGICFKILLTAAWMARKGQMRLRWLELRNMILFYIPCADMAALISNTDIHVQLDNVFYNMEVSHSRDDSNMIGNLKL